MIKNYFTRMDLRKKKKTYLNNNQNHLYYSRLSVGTIIINSHLSDHVGVTVPGYWSSSCLNFHLFIGEQSCFVPSPSTFAYMVTVMCKWWRFKVFRGRRVFVCEQIAVDVAESGQADTKT